jgi:PKD repeat protein/peptidoglycan/xylan/chitin deacetylase (PgdA/CDA1 family)
MGVVQRSFSVLFLLVVFAASSFAAHDITAWPDNKKGAVSLTFDEGCPSQISLGIHTLNASELRGTFFLTTDWIGGSSPGWDSWRNAANNGHEIASQSMTHPYLTGLTTPQVQEEMEGSKAAIDNQVISQQCLTFAYPYGDLNSAVESIAQNIFIASRGMACGLNTEPFSFFNVNACSPDNGDDIYAMADSAEQEGKWLVTIFHSLDQGSDCSGSWDIDTFETYLDYLMTRNLWVGTFASVVKYKREMLSATLSVISNSNDMIVLSLTDTLDDAIYDQPLTIRSEVPSSWVTATVQQGGNTIDVIPAVEGTTTVIYYNAVPDRGLISLQFLQAGNPQITELIPSFVTAGDPGFMLQVTGDNFVPGSVVRWNGGDIATTFVSVTQLDASVPSADLAAPGTVPVTVFNPDGSLSNEMGFEVIAPQPVIFDLSPSWESSGAPSFTLTVDGSNFVSGSRVRWDGSDRATGFVSGTELIADILAEDIATSGTASVTVYNPPPGGGSSNALDFDIFPVLGSLSLSPSSVVGGYTSTGTVTLSGPAPGGGAVVSLSSSNSSVASVPGNVTVPGSSVSATPPNAINLSSCSESDVNEAINAAVDGDTIVCPAGDWSWSNVDITKNITLQGAGIDQTNISITAAGGIESPNSYHGAFRVTGFTFTETENFGRVSGQGGFRVYGNEGFRIDHNKFNCYSNSNTWRNGVCIYTRYDVGGLIDHNQFLNARPGSGYTMKALSIEGNGLSAWDLPANTISGPDHVIYIEDNYFYDSEHASSWNGAAISGQTGALFVFRHNDVWNLQVDAHGYEVIYGTKEYEVSNNTFHQNNRNLYRLMYLRGGTGVIYGNTLEEWGDGNVTYGIRVAELRATSDRGSTGRPELYGGVPSNTSCQNAEGYPCVDSIGRGQSIGTSPNMTQTTSPLYIWNNDLSATRTAIYSETSSTYVQENRDYYYNQGPKPGYTPYTYPHPLATNTLPGDSTSTTFPVTTNAVSNSAAVTISALYGDVTLSSPLTVDPPPPAPVAQFTGTPTSGGVPLDVAFADSSTGEVTSWSWTFGDTGSSTAQNPSHTYSAPGTYAVSLTVTGPGGSDSETKTDYITVTSPAPTLVSLSLSPSSVVGGSNSTGTVTLSGPAPGGGVVVSLSSSNTSAATVPGNVTVAGGNTTATFTVTTVSVSSSTAVDISGLYGGVTRSSVITVESPANQPPLANAGPDQTVTDSDWDGSESVTLDGSGSTDADGTIVSYVWREGGVTVASGVSPTVPLGVGVHTLTLEVTDDGGRTATDTVVITVMEGDGAVTVEVRVATGADDAEERSSGSMSLNSSDLELVYDGGGNQTVGIRFNGVNIPAGASILRADVQFQVDETSSGATSLVIRGEDADNAGPFLNSTGNISSRPFTAASVSWVPLPWTVVGEAGPAQQTPDISLIIQEIVDRSGWSNGNSLVIVITGTGERVAESYNGNSGAAPLLHVEYMTGGAN